MTIRATAYGLVGVAAAATATAAMIPAPEGLKPCPSGDPVAAVESQLATKVGGDFLSCFRSDPIPAGPVHPTSMPVEYAFAIGLRDRVYTASDLHTLLAKVEEQWQGFAPQDGKLDETYLAKLKGLLGQERGVTNATIQSIRPVLVKIDGHHDAYYTVTSIRTYRLGAGSEGVTAVKVTGDAVALRNGSLVRLTIQRDLADATDVERVETDVDRWAKAVVSLS